MAVEEQNPAELIEAYYERGWTDGLPVVPPSEQSIAAMLTGASLRGDETIGEIEERGVVVSARESRHQRRHGGLPTRVPARGGRRHPCLCHLQFAYHGPASSTGGSAMVSIVNGPVARRIGINSGNNAFGQGTRANATIGRAVRLTMMNVMNTRPGFLDRADLQPGKHSLRFAENEVDHPWEPLHVERGCRPDQSAVTVYASNSLCRCTTQLAGRTRWPSRTSAPEAAACRSKSSSNSARGTCQVCGVRTSGATEKSAKRSKVPSPVPKVAPHLAGNPRARTRSAAPISSRTSFTVASSDSPT